MEIFSNLKIIKISKDFTAGTILTFLYSKISNTFISVFTNSTCSQEIENFLDKKLKGNKQSLSSVKFY